MYVLGLYSDGNYFKVSFISKKKGKIHIEFLKEFNKSISNLDALKKSIEKKGSFLGGEVEIVTALPLHEVLVKKLVIPLVKEREVHKALELQLSLDDTFSSDSRLFVPKFCKKGAETEVTLYGVSKESMEKHLRDVEEHKIYPGRVSTISSALTAFSAFCHFPKDPYFIFHLGWEISSVHFFSDGKIAEESSFNMGFKHMIDAAQKDHLLVEGVDMDGVQEIFVGALDGGKDSSIKQCFEAFKHQVSRIHHFIGEKDAGSLGECKTVFTGYAEFSRAIKSYIPEINKKEIVPEHDSYTSLQLSSYAIEIGLALDDKSPNLAEGSFMTKGSRERVNKGLKKLTLAGTCMAAAVYLSVFAFFTGKEKALGYDYDIAISKVEEITSSKVLPYHVTKGDLGKNRKKILSLIKAKKQKDEVDRKPVPFTVISELFGRALPAGFTFDEINYQKDGEGALLTCYFAGDSKEVHAADFKDRFLSLETGISLTEEGAVEKQGDRCLVRVRVKG